MINDSREVGKLLFVDDNAGLLRVFTKALQDSGYEVTACKNGHAALVAFDDKSFDVVVSDVSMPGLNGVELMRIIRERDLDVPVILLSGANNPEIATRAVELGAFEYLEKPIAVQKLREVIQTAIGLGKLARVKREAITHLDQTKHRAGDLAGLEATFRRAMASLSAAFQPIIGANGECFGYEALMRSAEPALPHPGAVLDAAERLTKLPEVGARMRDLSAEAMGHAPGVRDLFVNFHPRDLFDPAVLDPEAPLAKIADRVVVEITERASLDGMGDVRSRATQLRELGYRIAIDDLGAGYAGLTAFATLEPDFVKLDMSIIRDIHHSSVQQKLVKSMTSLCHDLGILVVAEGIETQDELECVMELECDLLQGYLLAKPGPAFPDHIWPL